MKVTKITSCYIGPQISPEQFISEHVFIFLIKGTMTGYDGQKSYTIKEGEYCLARKNHLARYHKQKDEGKFEKVIMVFDEVFLKEFKKKHQVETENSDLKDAFVVLKKDKLVPNFISSLEIYYDETGKIDATFSKQKREELLLILLRTNPGLASILFYSDSPEKADLESFMNRNYKFNVSLERFAYLTGRSLSVFKRDFKEIFADTPSHWLIQKRLDEAYFLIDKKDKKPSEIYLDLGFEDLSHFSFVFKKKFGFNPTNLRMQTSSGF
ncbi:MAG: AraC family transcriptional regulator [Dyadobacter sp.]